MCSTGEIARDKLQADTTDHACVCVCGGGAHQEALVVKIRLPV